MHSTTIKIAGILGITAIFGIIFHMTNVTTGAVSDITKPTAVEKVQKGSVFVDVREKYEIEETPYDLENVIYMPMSELETRYKELPKDKEIILGCRSGNRSATAADFLVKNGYENVYNLEGGVLGWYDKR